MLLYTPVLEELGELLGHKHLSTIKGEALCNAEGTEILLHTLDEVAGIALLGIVVDTEPPTEPFQNHQPGLAGP